MFNNYDTEYIKIVKPILNNKYFKMTFNITHHGISRMEHSIKVSYAAYKIAKALDWNYKSVARGGLLHDFFLDGDERSGMKKFTDTFTHPRRALITSKKHFDINKLEENIIVSHMFPLYYVIPRYKESILVDIVDKIIGGNEMFREARYKTSYRFNYLFLLFMIFFTQK